MRTKRIFIIALSCIAFPGSVVFAQTQHFQFHWPTQGSAQVGIRVASNPNISGSPLVAGDEIGAFTSNGLCVGGTVWNGLSDVVISVWENDSQTPEIDGIQPGDTIRYRVWKQSTNTEYVSVTVTYSTGNGVYFGGTEHIISSLTALAPPDAPTLASPSEGATHQPTTMTLGWNAAARAESYQVQVSTNSSFTSFVVDDIVTTLSHQISALLNNTTYFWRVSATNSGGTSNWSITRSFTTTLAAPVLSSPANGASNQSTTLSLNWGATAGATNYHIQVSTSSSFTSFVVNDTTTALSRQLTSLLNNATYFWRVGAMNASGSGDWSAVWSFTTMLAAPVLASPADSSTNLSTTLILNWNVVSSAQNYRLQVSTSPAFTSFVTNVTTSAVSQEVSSLLTNTTYFWRVNATNSAGTGDWSAVWSFTTVPPPPAVPLLAAPSDNATLQSTTLDLSWNAVSDAEGYHLQVSSDSSFLSQPDINDSTITATTRLASSLTNATTYFWRIRSRNPGGLSGWSAVWRFTTIGVPMTQGVRLGQGWNMISSFVRPETPNLETLLADIQSNMVLMKNDSGQVYWPGIDNTIIDWDFRDGYQIYMLAPDTLMVPGNEIIPNMQSRAMAQGWHMVSYLRNDSLLVDSALSSIRPNIIIVKNNRGEVYWPAFNPNFNSIGKMKMGQGYQVKLSAASSLTYPPNNQSSPGNVITGRAYASLQNSSRNESAQAAHFRFKSNTGNDATLGIPASSKPMIGGSPVVSGDEIGVFTPEGLCVGGMVWDGSSAPMTIWGDDPQTPEIDGIRPGERIHYRIWRKSANEEFGDVPVTYSDGDGSYEHDGLFILSTFGESSVTDVRKVAGLPTAFALVQNYPNPFNPTTTIRYELPEATHVSLRVFNVLGNEVAVVEDKPKAAGRHTVQFDSNNLSSGVYFYRLEAAGFVQTRRMVLVR